MSDDIVTRLRDLQERPLKSPVITGAFREAADEIERLRLENKKIVNAGYLLADFIQHNTACSCTDNDLCKKCSTLNGWNIAIFARN